MRLPAARPSLARYAGRARAVLCLALAPEAAGAQTPAHTEPTHLGAPNATLEPLARPTDAAFDPERGLLVLEGASRTAARFATRADAAEEARPALAAVGAATPLEVAGSPPGPGRASGLAPVAGDAPALVWCDAERHVVVLAPREGEPVVLAARGAGPREVFAPEGVACRGRRVAVADTGNRRALVLDLDGAEPVALGAGRLVRPMDVAFLDDARVAVVDADTSRVEIFSTRGEWLAGFGDWGSFPGLLAAPTGLDAWNGRIFVADTDNHRVQVFDEQGALAYSFGVHAVRPGEGDGVLHYPSDVAVARDGSLAAVVEPLDGRVQIFRRAPGAEPLEDPLRFGFGQPSPHYGRVADVDGRFMVIAEPESRRILLFDLRLDDPVQIGSIGGHGERLGATMRPTGLHLDAARRELLVADAALKRISRVRLAIDPAEELRFDAARESWVEAIELARLGPEVAGAGPRAIAPGALERSPEGAVFVVDEANARVLELGADLVPVRVLLDGAQGLVAPSDLALAPAGEGADAGAATLHVADAGRGGVWSVPLAAPGEAAFTPLPGGGRASHLALHPSGALLVSDSARHAVRAFEQRVDPASGARTLVPVAGIGEGVEGASDVAASTGDGAVDSTPGALWIARRGMGPGRFCEPADLGVDSRGRLIVIDHGNHRGLIFDAELRLVHGFGSRLYLQPLQLTPSTR